MYSRLSKASTRKTSISRTRDSKDPERSASQEQSLSSLLPHKDPYDTSNIYASYEELPNFYKDTADFFGVFKDLEAQASDTNVDWRIQFDVLESLRIINKYYPTELIFHLDAFTGFIQGCMDNLRTNLSKNALLLVKELIEHFKEVKPTEKFLDPILPKVIEKSISDKAFIKTEARATLKSLEKNGCNETVITVLCRRSFDKNPNISELSFETLAELVKEVKENLEARINSEYLAMIFQTIGGAINGKRAASKRVAEDLCQEIKGSLPVGEEELEKYLVEKMKMKEYDAKVIVRAVHTKKVKSSKSDFSAFIKEKKLKKESKDDVKGDSIGNGYIKG